MVSLDETLGHMWVKKRRGKCSQLCKKQERGWGSGRGDTRDREREKRTERQRERERGKWGDRDWSERGLYDGPAVREPNFSL